MTRPPGGAAPADAGALPRRSRNTMRVALRFSRRTALRRRGRSVLVAAMIAIPVAGMSAGTVYVASGIPTTEERIGYTLGQADARIDVVSPPDPNARQDPASESWLETDRDPVTGQPTGYDPEDPLMDPRDVLPSDAEVRTLSESSATVRTVAGVGGVAVLEGDGGQPELEGRTQLIDGRAPRNGSEVALNAAAMERLGVGIGDEVVVTQPRAVRLDVVGQVEDRRRPGSQAELFVRPGAITGATIAEQLSGTSFYVIGHDIDWDEVQNLNRRGFQVYSRTVVLDPPPASDVDPAFSTGSWTDLINSSQVGLIAIAGAFALFEVCLLAGAALLVGTRSDLRALATMASVGADRRVLFRAVSSTGLVLGGVGAVVGVGIGVLAGWAAFAILDDGNSIQFPGFHPEPVPLIVVGLIGVLAGWLASLAAARTAARLDIVAALRGARRPRPARRGAWAAGIALVIAGGTGLAGGGVLEFLAYWPDYDDTRAWMGLLLIVVGAIVMQIGAVIVVPSILRGAARVMSRFGTAARIASRDAARTTARSVPTLAAVMSTIFLASFLATFLSSGQAATDRSYDYWMEPGAYSGPLLTGPADGTGTTERGFADPEQVRDLRTLLTGVLGDVDVDIVDAALPAGYRSDATDDDVSTFPSVDPAYACGNVSAPDCDLPARLRSAGSPLLYVGDADTVATLLDAPSPPQVTRILDQGGAVALSPEFLHDDGSVRLETRHDPLWVQGEPPPAPDSGTFIHAEELHATLVTPAHTEGLGVVISPDTADRLGIDHGPSLFVAYLDTPPSSQQNDALFAGYSSLPSNAGGVFAVYGRYEAGPPQYGEVSAWIALGIAALVTFAASAVAIGLARADARRDDEVLDAVGAPPALRRSIAFWQAITVGLIGCVIGAAIGLLPTLALSVPPLIAAQDEIPTDAMPISVFAPPWLQLGLAVVAVPLAIALGSWLVPGRRRIAVRRTE